MALVLTIGRKQSKEMFYGEQKEVLMTQQS